MNDSFELIKQDFFGDDCPIKIKWGLEGQRLIDGHITIGAKTGPEATVFGLTHEMAHFVELDIERILKKPVRNWDLRNGSSFVVGDRFVHMPITTQAIEREARVWAYEISLRKKYGLDFDVDYMVAGADFISAWDIYRARFDSNNAALSSLKEHVISLSDTTHTFEVFKEEWNRRVSVLVQ